MPLLTTSDYQPPAFLHNGHLQTIFPTLFRRLPADLYQRERIRTDDDDFLDLDWSRIGSRLLAIVSHGLEGNSHRSYVVGMVRALNDHGWDALAWNYRSCSGEPNRRLRFYHNGSIEDLETVIAHALASRRYDRVALVGFSLGGNLTLVYLGSQADKVDARIEKAVLFSVPCDLADCAHQLAKPACKPYMQYFLRSLHKKIRAKMALMPGRINDDQFAAIKTFKQYDDRYTAPLHGFKNAEDYWEKCSSRPLIPKVCTPTLVVNAGNDPFLTGGCYPVAEVTASRHVSLEMPASGGHVGFIQIGNGRPYWSEARAVAFLNGG